MAKIEKIETQEPQAQSAPVEIDKTPEQAFKDDWKANHHKLAVYITQKGKMRGGLKPSDQIKAREILKSYGFRT